MVFISDDNSEIGAHVWTNVGQMICLRLLVRLRQAKICFFSSEKTNSYVGNMFWFTIWYKCHGYFKKRNIVFALSRKFVFLQKFFLVKENKRTWYLSHLLLMYPCMISIRYLMKGTVRRFYGGGAIESSPPPPAQEYGLL